MGNQFTQHLNYTDLENRKLFEYYGKKISKKHMIQYLDFLLKKCPNIESLTLNGCRIKTLQADIDIPSLKILNLSDNHLESIPEMNLPKLKHLDLSHNSLNTIPKSILNFTDLEFLNLSYNLIKSIDIDLDKLLNLKELKLRKNNLNQFPDIILQLSNLTTLDLSENAIDEIPNNMEKLICLKQLNLSNNNIQSFEMLTSLTNLTSLNLSNNRLESMDEEVFTSFQKLIELDLSHCRISYLPKSLFTLTSLQKLKLNGNRLFQLNAEIGLLKNLTELHIHDNQLNKISKSISKCKNLEVLYCEFNSLTKLPNQLRFIKNLRYLTLHYNKFKSIPDVLYEKQFVSNMYIISLKGNPFPEDLEKSINSKGTKEFLIEKLTKEEKQGTRKTNRRSLVRLASQYGTLRGRPVELDLDLSELNLNEEKSIFPKLNNSHTRSSSAKIPDRGQLQTVFENERSKSPEREKPKRSLRLLSTKRMSLRNLKPEWGGKDKTQKDKLADIEEEKKTLNEPTVERKLQRKLSTSITPIKSVANTMTIMEFLDKYKNRSIPHYSKFRAEFEELLKQINFKESTLKQIEEMSVEDKWAFLEIYKRNLVYLLNINIVDEDRNKQFEEILKSMYIYNVEKSVSYIISNLSSNTPCSMHFFINIMKLLSYAPLRWVYEFISKGGPEYLSKALKEIQMKVSKSPEDFVKENEILVSLHIISFVSPDAILFSYSSMDAFLYSLKSDQMSTQRLALLGLSNILKNNPTAGLHKIISSLEKIKTFYNMPNRFSIILDVLSKSKSLPNCDISTFSFSLIHEIILSEKDPLERYLLRKELMKFGLKEFIEEQTEKCDKKENKDQDLALKVVAFNRISSSDTNHVNTLLATDYRVLQRIKEHEQNLDREYKQYFDNKQNSINKTTSKRHSINLDNLDKPRLRRSASMKSIKRTSDPKRKRFSFKPIKIGIEDELGRKKTLVNDSIPEEKTEEIEKFTGTLKILIGDHGTTSMRIDETTTVSFIIQKILNKYPIDRPEQYGFFLLSLNGLSSSKGFWVVNHNERIAKLIKSFGDSGCLASYKLKPWKLPINVLFKHRVYKVDIEPSWTVEQTIAFIATNNDFSLEDEYSMNLYVENKINKEEETLIESSSDSQSIDELSSREVIVLPESITLMSLLDEPYNVPIKTLQDGKKCILELSYKPKMLKIILPNNIVKSNQNELYDETVAITVDYKWNQKTIIEKIMEKIPSMEKSEDYCIFIEPKKQIRKRFSTPIKPKRETHIRSGENTSILMKEDNNLYFYGFDTRRHFLRVSLVPQSLYISLPDGTEKHIKVLFSEYVSNIINLIVKDFMDDESENSGQYYCLFNGNALLSRRKTLLDAGIEPNAHLILKKDNFEYDICSKNDLLSSKTEGTEFDEISENFDINIYEESDGEEFIQYEDDKKEKIYAATFNKLIEKLTEPDDYDDHFFETFLFTYRSFATETELLRKIIQRYNVPDDFPNKEKCETIRVRVCIFLTRWIDREYDIIDERTLEKLNVWVENEIKDERRDILLNTINKVRKKREKREAPIDPVHINIDQHKLINKKTPSLLDLDDNVIATQLTLDIWNIYSQLKPKDFFDRSWTDANNKSPHISEMINRFNKISNWVATEICSEGRLKVRREKLKRFIKIANYLKELKNFHILYAVVSGINSTPVSRLKSTFEKLGKQKQILNELEEFLSMDGSFRNYRDTLNAITNTACIPYIAVLLKDLTFIEDGNSNTVDGLINWSKRKLFFDVVGSYLRFVIANFNVAPVIINGVHIKDIIDNLPCLDEQTLYEKSLLLEPKGNQ